MSRDDRETDILRLDDLAEQYGLTFQRRGSLYIFNDFIAHGLRQALGFAEGYDRAMLDQKSAQETTDA